jgi:lipopolysaccharide assembly protein A
MRVLTWLLRLFLLFTLFAFSLNNTQPVTVQWFFGYHWQTPLVFLVFVTFVAGAALGVLAMVPAWWRHRREARRQNQVIRESLQTNLQESPPAVRDGL